MIKTIQNLNSITKYSLSIKYAFRNIIRTLKKQILEICEVMIHRSVFRGPYALENLPGSLTYKMEFTDDIVSTLRMKKILGLLLSMLESLLFC